MSYQTCPLQNLDTPPLLLTSTKASLGIFSMELQIRRAVGVALLFIYPSITFIKSRPDWEPEPTTSQNSSHYIIYSIFSLNHHCNSINIFGDSQIIINWINGISTCHIHTLSVILNEVLELKAAFNNITVSHIYREHNNGADKLSKEAAMMDRGMWEISEIKDHQEQKFYHRPNIDPKYPTTGRQTA